MKKLICLSSLLLFAIALHSQQVVTDPGLTKLATKEEFDRQIMKTNMLDQLRESITQTEQLQESLELARKGYETLVEVNELLRDLEMIERAIERQEKLVDHTQEMISRFDQSNVFSVSEFRKITDHLIELIDGCTDIIEMFDMIITPDKTKMNDSERMQALMNIEKSLAEKQAVTKASVDYYQDIMEERETIEALEEMAKKMNEQQ